MRLALCLWLCVVGSAFGAAIFPQPYKQIEVQVTPNAGSSTYGIQEALNQIPAGGPQWGTNITGGLIRLKAGDYYLTNAVFYSNTFPYGIKLQGAGVSSTRLIYAGLGTTTNVITFTGGGNPNGGLNLPGQVEVCDLTITSITNMQGALLVITNCSDEYVHNVNFTGWELLTNNLHGPALSIDGPAPTQAPGNIGMVIGSSLDHATRIENIFVAGLACGLNAQGDHLYVYNFKTAYIGQYGAGPSDGTAWANTSPYFLGSAIYRSAALDTQIINAHFYQCDTAIAWDAAAGSVVLQNISFETVTHGICELTPGSSSASWYINNAGKLTDDGGGPWGITHTPYALSTSTAVDIRYPTWTKMIAGLDLNGNSTQATNFSRFAVRTNICLQPAAGFNPNFSNQSETATTNNGANTAVVFTTATLPAAFAGDVTYHEVLVHKLTGNDGPIILPVPYVTNISGVFRCTNNTLLTFRLWPGVLTNVFSNPIN